ncbi:MAG: diacylglycerol/lipid kinase family protein [Candidatus Promineifilaceae bacterium]
MMTIIENTATLIYNPLAGPADLANTMERIAQRWRTVGWEIDIRSTKAAGHAVQLAADAVDRGRQLVLAAGGDGTLGEVVNGLAGSQTMMGVLPAGTANSFARELKLPLPGLLHENNLLTASDALMAGYVQTVDLGYTASPENAGGRYWILWTGTGADSYLVNELEPRPKWSKRIGWPSYVVQGIPTLPKFSHIHARVEVDGHHFEDDYILVLISNCQRYAGGFVTLSPDAKVDDGLLEVWLFGGRGLLTMSRHAIRTLQGQASKEPDALLLRGKEITIQTDPLMPAQTDGEPAGETPLYCRIVPASLKLLTPRSAPRSLFTIQGPKLLNSG